MDITDLKIYGLNLLAFTISLTQIDVILKIVLLLISICYTGHKWYLMYEKNK